MVWLFLLLLIGIDFFIIWEKDIRLTQKLDVLQNIIIIKLF